MGSGRRVAGWLAIPAFLLALALVGMAIATESRDSFEQRAGDRGQPGGGGGQGDPGDGDRRGGTPERGSRTERGDRDGRAVGEPGGEAGEGRQPIVIQTGDGEFVVQLDEDGNPRSVVAGDDAAPTDPDRYLSPDPDGGYIGLRVTDDGTVEPVEIGDLRDDDFLVRAEGDGVDITRPDGSRITLEPTDEGTLRGEDIAIDGTVTPLTPDGGEITVQPADRFEPGFSADPDAEPLVLGTGPGGDGVRIELDDDGDLVARQVDGDGGIALHPDDLSAIRIGEDGNLEVVPLDQVGPDDTVLVPTGDGFDLVRPDGSRVEFRADGDNDGVTATEISPDGEATELVPNPDGSVTLSDGTTVGPVDIAEDGGTIERLLDQTSDLPWPWVFGAIAALALLSIGTAVYLHRSRPHRDLDLGGLAAHGVPDDQFERFLALLRDDPDPTRAIRLAFYAAERGLAGLPTRRVQETPFEWLGRVEQVRPDLASPLAAVCDLFAMARFAPGQATEADRQAMITHLRQLNRVATEAPARPLAGV